jgi:hypothetical protein
MKTRALGVGFFLIWLTVILAAYFIVQKPDFVNIAKGLFLFLASVAFGFGFTFTGIGVGYWTTNGLFDRMDDHSSPVLRLIFSFGVGMGILGILGFSSAALGMANGYFLPFGLAVLFLLFYYWILRGARAWRYLLDEIFSDLKESPRWIPVFAIIIFALSALYSFAPPVEGFDGLFYHLTVPSLWLADDGLQLVNIPHYWFPALMEGLFVWPLSIGFDTVPQFIHLTFSVMSLLIVWVLTRRVFGVRTAWWSTAIFLSMPSLPWLAGWAYSDFGLVFYSLSALFALVMWNDLNRSSWLLISGVLSGFAIGIKYTIFLLPIVVMIFLFLWRKGGYRLFLRDCGLFAGSALFAGGVWYLRNWIWTGNPFYPFLFGGFFWDDFRANWFSGAGTGIGWDFFEIITLPFTAMLGYHDQNYFDGRYGPLFLFLLPFAILALWKKWKSRSRIITGAILPFLVFGVLFSAAWGCAVVNTISLFQTRLLWPGLIALIPVLAAGVDEIEKMNLQKLRVSFIFSVLACILVLISTLDFALFMLVRNPLQSALGMETRISYIMRIQPEYGQALQLAEKTPESAYIYMLSEPRSYGMNRRVQPDAISDNLPHDFHLFAFNEDLIAAWKKQGYTHVLARRIAFYPIEEGGNLGENRLANLMNKLTIIEETEDFILFEIP